MKAVSKDMVRYGLNDVLGMTRSQAVEALRLMDAFKPAPKSMPAEPEKPMFSGEHWAMRYTLPIPEVLARTDDLRRAIEQLADRVRKLEGGK